MDCNQDRNERLSAVLLSKATLYTDIEAILVAPILSPSFLN